MIILIKKKNVIRIFVLSIVLIFLSLILLNYDEVIHVVSLDDDVQSTVDEIFDIRNKALLKGDVDSLKYLYDREKKYGIWAYEHEMKKLKYIKIWSDKQNISFSDIDSDVVIRNITKRKSGYRINFLASTEYKYFYINEKDTENMFRIGTYHSIDLEKQEDKWVITREWYTDPFADSLNLNDIKAEKIKEYIVNHKSRDLSNINNRRKKALEYIDKYCGAASDEEYGYKYNKKYKDYNPLGGDCANFASQMLYEGGGFKRNYTWNYDGGGSKAWVNAHGFKSYMIYSGRASVVASGSYEKVYKAAYKLLPGDFVAYGKNGKVTHISVVSGADSKGYTLVNSHNTDRYRVPWDLGWSNKGIKFWLVHVHY